MLNRKTAGGTQYLARYYYQDGALWDHGGNPLKKVENWGGSDYTTTWRYDHLYRLTEDTRRDPNGNPNFSLLYGYDQVGNRTSRNKSGTTVTYTYDDNDKLVSASDGSSFGYDLNGSMTSVSGPLGSWTLAYNDESRPTSITHPSGGGSATENYLYNALGQRMRAQLGGVWSRFVYHGDRVLEQTDDAGNVTARYTTESGGYYAPLLHLWVASGSLSRHPLYDAQGTVRRVVDDSAVQTDFYTHNAFGYEYPPTGSTPNPYRFGGAWGYITDTPGSGLLQLGARFYWPEVGRFLQQDPLWVEINLYAYCRNNPLHWADPSGLFGAGLGGSATGGLGVVLGAAGTVNAGGGWFSGGGWGGFASGGGFVGAPGHAITVPQNGWPNPTAVGAYAGAGANVWFSPNANKPSDLGGKFHNYSVNLGAPFAPWLRLSVGLSWADNGIWMISIGPPFVGLGAGLGVFQHDTCTFRIWGK